MRILSLESCCGPCSVAIARDGEIVAREEEPSWARQAERLVPMVEDALLKADMVYADLDLLAVTIGPGSFTGVRIGLAVARGIAMAGKIPLMGLTTLEIMASEVSSFTEPEGDVWAVALTAGRGQFYVQRFDRLMTPLEEPDVADPVLLPRMLLGDDRRPATIISNHWQSVREAVADRNGGELSYYPQDVWPTAARLAQRAEERLREGGCDLTPQAARHVRPLYIRPPDAKLPA